MMLNSRQLFFILSVFSIALVGGFDHASAQVNPPYELVATAVSSNQINLVWSPATKVSDGTVVGSYKIEVDTGSGFVDLATVTKNSYSHTGVSAGSYTYRIIGIDSSGSSPPSNIDTATISGGLPDSKSGCLPLIRRSWSFDVDSCSLGTLSPNDDFWWKVEDNTLTPLNSAKMVMLGNVDFNSVTDPIQYSYSSAKIAFSKNTTPLGTVFVTQTNAGKYAKMLVENFVNDYDVELTMYYLSIPAATSPNLSFGNLRIKDVNDNPLSAIQVGQTIAIQADITNNGDAQQSFAYVVEIRDVDGVTIYNNWQTGILDPHTTINPGLSQTFDSPGNYQIIARLVDDVQNPQVLAPQLSINVSVSGVQSQTITIGTDESSYTSGDTITVAGAVSPIVGPTVIIQIFSKTGVLVRVDQIDVSSNGKYVAEIVPGGVLWDNNEGAFTIKATYGAVSKQTQIQYAAVEMPEEKIPEEAEPPLSTDSDDDGIMDPQDSCVNEKEIFNEYQDSDGCPDMVPTVTNGDGNMLLIIIAAIAVVGGGGVAVFLMKRKKSDDHGGEASISKPSSAPPEDKDLVSKPSPAKEKEPEYTLDDSKLK